MERHFALWRWVRPLLWFFRIRLTEYIAEKFTVLNNMPFWLLLTISCLSVAMLTELISNVATVQILLPVIAALAVSQNINPLRLMIPATLVSSMAFMMPVATPPNAVIFGSQRLKVFEMVKGGIFIKIATFLIICVLVTLIMSWGLGIT
ncbi:MAG: hypothetical protein HC906_08515 [Bacteroidales bacterium]|nr:hypothetical protein [Bacteroidales bacterium]